MPPPPDRAPTARPLPAASRAALGAAGAAAGAAALAAAASGWGGADALHLATAGAGPAAGVWSGPLVVAALVVAAAGGAKLARPRPTAAALAQLGWAPPAAAVPLLGGAEVALGLGAAALGGRGPAVALAACYLAFAAVSLALARTGGGAGCGCFGAAGARPGTLHLLLTLSSAAAAGAGAASSAGGIAALVSTTPLAGVPALAACGLGAALLVAAYTLAPDALGAPRADGGGGPQPFRLREGSAR